MDSVKTTPKRSQVRQPPSFSTPTRAKAGFQRELSASPFSCSPSPEPSIRSGPRSPVFGYHDRLVDAIWFGSAPPPCLGSQVANKPVTQLKVGAQQDEINSDSKAWAQKMAIEDVSAAAFKAPSEWKSNPQMSRYVPDFFLESSPKIPFSVSSNDGRGPVFLPKTPSRGPFDRKHPYREVNARSTSDLPFLSEPIYPSCSPVWISPKNLNWKTPSGSADGSTSLVDAPMVEEIQNLQDQGPQAGDLRNEDVNNPEGRHLVISGNNTEPVQQGNGVAGQGGQPGGGGQDGHREPTYEELWNIIWARDALAGSPGRNQLTLAENSDIPWMADRLYIQGFKKLLGVKQNTEAKEYFTSWTAVNRNPAGARIKRPKNVPFYRSRFFTGPEWCSILLWAVTITIVSVYLFKTDASADSGKNSGLGKRGLSRQEVLNLEIPYTIDLNSQIMTDSGLMTSTDIYGNVYTWTDSRDALSANKWIFGKKTSVTKSHVVSSTSSGTSTSLSFKVTEFPESSPGQQTEYDNKRTGKASMSSDGQPTLLHSTKHISVTSTSLAAKVAESSSTPDVGQPSGTEANNTSSQATNKKPPSEKREMICESFRIVGMSLIVISILSMLTFEMRYWCLLSCSWVHRGYIKRRRLKNLEKCPEDYPEAVIEVSHLLSLSMIPNKLIKDFVNVLENIPNNNDRQIMIKSLFELLKPLKSLPFTKFPNHFRLLSGWFLARAELNSLVLLSLQEPFEAMLKFELRRLKRYDPEVEKRLKLHLRNLLTFFANGVLGAIAYLVGSACRAKEENVTAKSKGKFDPPALSAFFDFLLDHAFHILLVLVAMGIHLFIDSLFHRYEENAEREIHDQGGPGEVQGQGSPGEVEGQGSPGEVQGQDSPGEVQGQGNSGEVGGQGSPGEVRGQGNPGEVEGQGSPGEVEGQGSPGEVRGQVNPG